MRVVSNTSPICNLAILDRLEWLRRRYGRVVIPAAVAHELAALTHRPGKMAVQDALTAGWLVVETVNPSSLRAMPISLDAGETEAIQLALANQSGRVAHG